jgi:hypothetical protein
MNLLDIRTRNLKYILDKVISSSRIGPDDLVGAFFHPDKHQSIPKS